MAISLNKLPALVSHQNTEKNQRKLTASLQKLGSGLRVNSAADDAAGLAVSEKMRSQIRSYNVAERNTFDGMSMAQTADGALGEMHDILGRMRELAMQSGNGALTDDNRSIINEEFSQLQGELTRMQESTKFNGVAVVGSTASDAIVQAGPSDSTSDQITLRLGGVDLGSTVAASTGVGSGSSALLALGQIDTAIETLSESRASLGASINRLDVAGSNIQSMKESLVSAEARIRDADVALEASGSSGAQVLSQMGAAVQAQANSLPQHIHTLLEG